MFKIILIGIESELFFFFFFFFFLLFLPFFLSVNVSRFARAQVCDVGCVHCYLTVHACDVDSVHYNSTVHVRDVGRVYCRRYNELHSTNQSARNSFECTYIIEFSHNNPVTKGTKKYTVIIVWE